MSQSKRARNGQSHEQRRPVQKRDEPAQARGEQSPASELAAGFEDASFQDQAARLGDGRLPLAQRRAMAARIGQVAGNKYLQRVVAHQRRAAGERRDGRAAPFAPRAKAAADSVQRWDSPEHMALGDVIDRRIDIGEGVSLTFGQVVALAGDEFGSLEALMAATETEDGRAMIRAHLERARIPGDAADLLPAPTEEQRDRAGSEYVTLAMDNSAHFVGGGTAFENWFSKHAEAIDLAIQAGLYHDEALLNEAYMTEAFGDHFLTDAFSSGHIRVPREAITQYYVNEFAPRVFDHLLDHLRGRLIDEIYDQVDEQTVLNEAAYVVGGLFGGLGVREYIRRTIRDEINAKLNAGFAAAGGRHAVIQKLGLGVAGIVAGAMHDMENREGLWVVSDINPEPWQAFGDERLDENPEHREQVEEAVRVAVADLQTAYDIGVEEGQNLFNVVDLEWLPSTVYFGFDLDTLSPEAASQVDMVAHFLSYNSSTLVTLVGHADPVGDDPYNEDLGSRRANRVAQRLFRQGVDPSRLKVESMGESVPVATSRAQYHLNRRVEFVYATGADREDKGPDETAFENAQAIALTQIGPPYWAERYLPRAAEGRNPELPEWRWGDIPASFRGEMASWISHYVGEYSEDALSNEALDDIPKETPVGDFTISPRPIARRIVNEVLANPVGFLERAFGREAGP